MDKAQRVSGVVVLFPEVLSGWIQVGIHLSRLTEYGTQSIPADEDQRV